VPPRAAEIDAACIQFFTKQPNRWAERVLKEDDIAGYRKGIGEGAVTFACAHDSYLINLATADEASATGRTIRSAGSCAAPTSWGFREW